MLDILLDSGQYALENLVVPVAASLATLWANAKVAKRRAAAEDVADHDRRAAEINDDLRRWIHDRDREARVRMEEIRQDAQFKGVASGGVLAQAAGKVYRHVLHEYRDRGTSPSASSSHSSARKGEHIRDGANAMVAPPPNSSSPTLVGSCSIAGASSPRTIHLVPTSSRASLL